VSRTCSLSVAKKNTWSQPKEGNAERWKIMFWLLLLLLQRFLVMTSSQKKILLCDDSFVTQFLWQLSCYEAFVANFVATNISCDNNFVKTLHSTTLLRQLLCDDSFVTPFLWQTSCCEALVAMFVFLKPFFMLRFWGKVCVTTLCGNLFVAICVSD